METHIILRGFLFAELLVANWVSVRPSSAHSMAVSCQRDERLLVLSGSGLMVSLQTNS